MANENPSWGYTGIWDALRALNYFSVEVLSLAGIIRLRVLLARNLTDPVDGFLCNSGYLIVCLFHHGRGPVVHGLLPAAG